MLLLTFNFVALILASPVPLGILALVIILTFKFSRIPFQDIRKFAIIVLIASQAVLISYLFGSAIQGSVMYVRFPWGTFISNMTLLFALTMILRYTCMLLGSTLVLSATNDRDITYGLATMHVPHAITFVLTLAFRSTTIFIEDFQKVRDAMILRGASLDKGSILERTRKYGHIFVSLIVIALRRVMETAYAIEAKGISVPVKRTYLHRYPTGVWDITAAVILVAAIMGSWFGRYWFQVFSFPGWPLQSLIR
jgi:energy-coupling factor transporter transmembrane protein EcfT